MADLLTPEQRKQISRLKFPQPMESDFWLDWAEKIRGPAGIICIAGFVLCTIYIIATYLFFDAEAQVSNMRSVGSVLPVLFLTFFLSKNSKAWLKINPVLLWLAVAAMAAANGYSIVLRDQHGYERALIGDWMFFSVVVIGSGLALVRSAAVAMLIVLGSYLFLAFGIRGLTEPARTSNLMVLGQTVLFSMAAAYVAEVRARREFMLGKLLDEERRNTHRLLTNVLPEQIASRLMGKPGSLAERHEDASVLFADIVNFTPFASSREPDEVVGFLDGVFSRFDELIEGTRLEKIKTVGDAYMVAGGVLGGSSDHLASMADLAIQMLKAAKEAGVEMRIGVHCGPLVAGVIGRRKFLYDLWGETVNTASRMESHGIAGQVQVTSSVADRLDSLYHFEKRGLVEVKGIGPVETYILLGRKSPNAEGELAGVSP